MLLFKIKLYGLYIALSNIMGGVIKEESIKRLKKEKVWHVILKKSYAHSWTVLFCVDDQNCSLMGKILFH